jgi:hypothetical protein
MIAPVIYTFKPRTSSYYLRGGFGSVRLKCTKDRERSTYRGLERSAFAGLKGEGASLTWGYLTEPRVCCGSAYFSDASAMNSNWLRRSVSPAAGLARR